MERMEQIELFETAFLDNDMPSAPKKSKAPQFRAIHESNKKIHATESEFKDFENISKKREKAHKKTLIKNLPLSELKNDYKNVLNSSQFIGVTTTEGPVLLLAGAGSGKTHCLINRVAYLIEQGIMPERILLLTFTNKAAKEMQDRAAKVLDERCNYIIASTYHSFFNSRVLRHFGQYVGLKPGYTVIEPSDTVEIIDLIKTDKDLKKDKSFPKSSRIATYFSMSLNKNYSLEECLIKEFEGTHTEYIKELEDLQIDYEQYKSSHNLIDFDDILIKCITLFKNNESIREYYEGLFDYIMVDEYQDSNFLQDELVNLIRKENNNLCVVGDDSQCIYGFRGSIVRNIINFPKKHPGCQTIKLVENYRSSQEIMDLSNSFMRLHCTEGIPKSLIATHFYCGEKPQLFRPANEKEEAEQALEMIEDCLINGYDSRDIAVLSRSSTDTSQLEVLLTKNGYEYEKYGGLKFFDKEIVKDVLAFIKVIINYRDEVAWSRILKLLPAIGDKTVRKITPLCLKSGFVGLLQFKKGGKSGEVIKKNLFELHQLISKLMDNDNPETIMKTIVEYYYPLKKELIENMKTTDIKRDEYLSELKSGMEDANFLIELASQYEKLSSFVDDVILEKKTEKDDEKALKAKERKITISTIHSSKGLEWDTVFLLNCIDGRFPNIMPWQVNEKEKENNEELRCFYVAVTRAKTHLYMFAPQMARIGANFAQAQVSHFLKGSEQYYDTVSDNY